MDLPGFIQALAGDGRLIFESPEARAPNPAEEADAVRALEVLDERRRLEIAGAPPALNREQALWAARKLYRVAQFLVFRELPAEKIVAELSDDCPGLADAARQYSVDLVFCWLPEMHRRATSVSAEDELTKALLRFAAAYPLSAVGVPTDSSAERFEQLWAEPSLRALFVDRVIAQRAADRVADQRVCAAVRDALGEREADWLPSKAD